MKIPEHVSDVQAVCIPEVYLTAYQLLYKVAGLQGGENLLLHAGASAVSLAAAQIATKIPCDSKRAALVTALTRRAGKLGICTDAGAQALDREEFFADRNMRKGAYNVVLDSV